MTPRSLLALACIAAGALACAPTRTSLGDASLRRYSELNASPTTFGVQTGRVVSGNFDVAVDPDGCARGLIGSQSLVVCPKELPTDPDFPGERSTRWLGTGADFVTRIPRDERSVRVDGTVAGSGLHATLRFGAGPQWDELRREPELFALAASAVGIDGEPPPEAN